MLADAFVIPYHIPKCRKIWSILKFWTKHLVSLPDAFDRMRTDSIMDGSESRVISLVEQTPLSTAELIRCFERGISDVSTPEKVIAGIYPEDEATQARISLLGFIKQPAFERKPQAPSCSMSSAGTTPALATAIFLPAMRAYPVQNVTHDVWKYIDVRYISLFHI
jgi:hypothetical protein